jgi:membrane-bound metal-dependent hydrolase YbcI (DUF457 family)
MATPYGHSLLGLTLLNVWYPQSLHLSARILMAYGGAILLALSPDLDFIPGIFIGQPSFFHQGPFHSLGLALGLSSLALLGTLILGPHVSSLKITAFVFSMVLAHLVVDYLTEDYRAPIGFPFFWPFSYNRVSSPWPVFPHPLRDFGNPDFLHQNLYVFFVESVIFLPLFFLSWLRTAKRPESPLLFPEQGHF